jgi:hypothetical protein
MGQRVGKSPNNQKYIAPQHGARRVPLRFGSPSATIGA